MWRHAIRLAGLAQYRVVACQPTEPETGLPYAALGDLFESLEDDVLAALPVPQRMAMEIALLRGGDDQETPLQRRALSVAIVNVLIELSRHSPVVVAIDDVNWVDAPSMSILRFALRRLEQVPLGLLLTARMSILTPGARCDVSGHELYATGTTGT